MEGPARSETSTVTVAQEPGHTIPSLRASIRETPVQQRRRVGTRAPASRGDQGVPWKLSTLASKIAALWNAPQLPACPLLP